MKILAARFISIIAHPFVLLPLLIFLPQYQRDRSGASRSTFAFIAIVLVPLAVLIWRSVASGQWRTVDASDKTDRPSLYISSLLVSGAAAVYFYFVDHSPALSRGCITAGAMILVAFVLNRWIKISLHLVFASFCGLLLARVRLEYGLPILALVPALIWSRLILSRHLLSETLGGVILGVGGAACLIWL
jgi:hypothetical protein